jgi:hypothetical protein
MRGRVFTLDRGAAIAGKPAPTSIAGALRLCEHHRTCGSWLASDEAISIIAKNRYEKGDPKVAFLFSQR